MPQALAPLGTNGNGRFIPKNCPRQLPTKCMRGMYLYLSATEPRFTSSLRLRDTTVLRPDWLANGIYAILRANDTRHEKPLAREGIVKPILTPGHTRVLQRHREIPQKNVGGRAGEPWANLQRRGKAGDAQGERLSAGGVGLCAAADESLPTQLSP